MKKILEFNEEYSFLSNFYPSPIKFEDIVYPTVEHYYQAQKSDDINVRKAIADLNAPNRAKSAGRRIKIKDNWGNIKIDIMRTGINLKFDQNLELANKLINTYPLEIIEGNFHGDIFWGVSLKINEGYNWLGKLLMEKRKELMNE